MRVVIKRKCPNCLKYHSKTMEDTEHNKEEFTKSVESGSYSKCKGVIRDEMEKVKEANKLKEEVINNIASIPDIKEVAKEVEKKSEEARKEIKKMGIEPIIYTQVHDGRDLEVSLRPTGNTILLLGPSQKGKTILMMYIYKKQFANYISVLFADNPQSPVYKDKNLIVTEMYEPKIIKMAQFINKKTKNNYEFLFMLDDIVEKKNDKTLLRQFLTFRNSNISSIMSLQYDKLLDKGARNNVHNIFLFQQNNDVLTEDVIKNFLTSYLPRSTMSEKIKWYRDVTSNHGFIYVDTYNNLMKVFSKVPY